MAEKVKIKLLKSTPIGNAGDVVEVPKPLAEQMCQWRKLHDGHKEINYRSAMPADEKEPEPVIETAAQALAAGKKNIVVTPKEGEAPKEETPPSTPSSTPSEVTPLPAADAGADAAKGKKSKTGS